MRKGPKISDEEALRFHMEGTPGKLEIKATKPMATQRDLSLAYSPGVAAPVRAIAANPEAAYDYTARGNMVAVISNGTAILGLGNLGALASKPVMEGKSVLFKRFADVNSIDLELDATDPEEFINAVRPLSPSFGGINLEDIKAPDCFIIENRLREEMDIPVFHDDQHGTAIICAAGIVNALTLSGKHISQVKLVLNGAGAAGIACLELLKAMGLPNENAILCDTKGVIYKGRTEGMNQWKSAHAVDTECRTLDDAMKGADVFIGLSVQGAVTPEMIADMAPSPIIFAMANPDPEITPEEVEAIRTDAIVATGRSDYPNQVNNVLGFPYIFRGALDVRATKITEEMKIAAVYALAELAREEAPDEVAAAYNGVRPKFGKKYIIPVPFDPRLIVRIPSAVAKAAAESGVAKKPISDYAAYAQQLKARLDPTAVLLDNVYNSAKKMQKRIIFAEGERETVIRAAITFLNSGLGQPVLIGNPEVIHRIAAEAGMDADALNDVQIYDTRETAERLSHVEYLYERLQRRGYLKSDCERLLTYNTHVLGACLLAAGEADGMVTGETANNSQVLEYIRLVLENKPGRKVMGLSLAIFKGKTVIFSDTLVNESPDGKELAVIAKQAAQAAKRLGLTPRVAFLSNSNFGHPDGNRLGKIREAMRILSEQGADFEFDGEMGPDAALNSKIREDFYPFCNLTGDANVLIAPGIHSAGISVKLLRETGSAVIIGPVTMGLEASVQLLPKRASVSEIVTMAAFSAFDLNSGQELDTGEMLIPGFGEDMLQKKKALLPLAD
jgi:malate dehydrogenase (oxaloacetate-decarboxylating)(NADP+)